MFDWDDLRIFIAAARAGSGATAARQMRLDPSTVGRRLANLESALKATLFIRSASGLRLTSTGGRLLNAAITAESAMVAAAKVSELDIIAGSIRISASEGFGGRVLAPALAQLRIRHGNLSIELIANSGFLSPLRREVDMAVTLSAPASDRLLVEPLTDYDLGLYASQAYLDRHGVPNDPADLSRFTLVGYVEDQIYAPELRYLEEIHPDLTAQLASSSINAQREIVAAGAGIGVLPCFMALGLTPVLPDQVRLTRRFWISTHREVGNTARIRAVRRWMKSLVEEQRGILSPSRGAAAPAVRSEDEDA
jgi:DNA-binding transcriptional LysR family regulator